MIGLPESHPHPPPEEIVCTPKDDVRMCSNTNARFPLTNTDTDVKFANVIQFQFLNILICY